MSNKNLIDLKGIKFGSLLVLDYSHNDGKKTFWKCVCDCGREKIVDGHRLRCGRSKTCGICTKNIVGNRYGKLVVIERVEKDKYQHYLWKCQCDCGNIITVLRINLTNGSISSCGCDLGKNYLNKKINKLTVEKFEYKRGKTTYWNCSCECGTKITLPDYKLDDPYLRSCGCLPNGPSFVDYTGQEIKGLKVIKYVGKSKWLTNDKNGNEKIVKSFYFIKDEPHKKMNKSKLSDGEAAFNDLYHSYKRGAIKRDYSFDLDKEIFRKLTKQNCYYCGCEPNQKRKGSKGTKGIYIYNGIDRKDNTKGYTKDNCVSCCITCNHAKTTMTIEEFLNWILRLTNNIFGANINIVDKKLNI